MKIKIKKVHPDAKVPVYKTGGAAGCDVFALEQMEIKPGESIMIRTGISFEFPESMFVILAPRGSFCLKNNLDMPNSIAIGDSDFRGEYMMPIRNLGKDSVIVEKHERIGQFIFLNYVKADFEVVEELNETERGGGSFGSTGKF